MELLPSGPPGCLQCVTSWARRSIDNNKKEGSVPNMRFLQVALSWNPLLGSKKICFPPHQEVQGPHPAISPIATGWARGRNCSRLQTSVKRMLKVLLFVKVGAFRVNLKSSGCFPVPPAKVVQRCLTDLHLLEVVLVCNWSCVRRFEREKERDSGPSQDRMVRDGTPTVAMPLVHNSPQAQRIC